MEGMSGVFVDLVTLKDESRQGFREAVINDWADDARHFIGVRKEFPTACWSWGVNQAHNIHMGDKIDLRRTAKSSIKEKRSYLRSYLRHEMAHARWTSHDLKGLSEWCRSHDIPFSLLNLFEDARIEHLWREFTGLNFDWLKYEDPPTCDSASSALLCWIQAEGEEIEAPGGVDLLIAKPYYDRAILVKKTEGLKPLLLEWIKEFPEEKSSNGGSGGSGAGGNGAGERSDDMTQALMLIEAGEGDVAASVAVNSQGGDDSEPFKPNDQMKGEIGSQEVEIYGGDALFESAYENVSCLDAPAREAANRMTLRGEGPARHRSTTKPSRRLSARNVARDSDKVYRVREKAVRNGPVKLNAYVDLSGSMSGFPVDNARILLKALSILAQKGRISGSVMFHKGEGRMACLTKARLPLTDEMLSRVVADGSMECIEDAFKMTEKEAIEAEVNLCITDGHITDKPLDVERMRRKGIFTVGLYVDEGQSDEIMHQWFDRTIVRPTTNDLADEISRVMRQRIIK